MEKEGKKEATNQVSEIKWRPVDYNIHWIFDGALTECGSQVLVTVESALPLKNLDFDFVSEETKISEILLQTKKKAMPCKFFAGENRKKLTVALPETVSDSKLQLLFKYKCPIRSEQLIGLFASTTSDKIPLVLSHFEPHFAALCLPSIVDNSVASTFQLKVTYPKELLSFSCTPEESTADDGNMTTKTFEKTPAIPIYIFALALGKFSVQDEEYFSPTLEQKIPIRAIVPQYYFH
jgi:aminopeptidase N